MDAVIFVLWFANEDAVSNGWAQSEGQGVPGVLVTQPDVETGSANVRLFISSQSNALPFIEAALPGTDPGQYQVS